MMAITHAPTNLVIGSSDGIDIRFAGIELKDAPGYSGLGAGQPSIHLQLSGVRGEETALRDGRFEQDRLEWWERRRAAGSDRTENAPQMPGVAVFDRLTAAISDDIGTTYRLSGGQLAGDRTEWEARWIYTPTPPAGARTLRLEFSVDGTATGDYCELSHSKPTE